MDRVWFKMLIVCQNVRYLGSVVFLEALLLIGDMSLFVTFPGLFFALIGMNILLILKKKITSKFFDWAVATPFLLPIMVQLYEELTKITY
ncbi:MAG: hypothetical protein ACI4XN_07375 [Candidatus Kurthia intestinigallinarum]